jgi:hypothetical protein
MRNYQHTAFALHDRYDLLYGGNKSDAGVGSGRRRRFHINMDFASPQRCEKCTECPMSNENQELSPWGKAAGCEADHSPLTSSRSKNEWSYTPLHQYAFMTWCSVKTQGQLYIYL